MTSTTSTTIRPNQKMVAALTAKQLSDVLLALRNTIEGNPHLYGRQTQKLDRAERAIFDRRFNDARELMGEMQQGIEARDLSAAVQAGAHEQEALGEVRGEPTATTETGVKTRDGFLWLVNRKRYTPARVEAGRIFREKYAKSIGGSVKSCIAESTGGGGGDATPTAAQLHARFEIQGVARHFQSSIGAANGTALFSLLEAVCGRGETVRQLAEGDDRKADAKAIELGFALDLAGVYLGAVRT